MSQRDRINNSRKGNHINSPLVQFYYQVNSEGVANVQPIIVGGKTSTNGWTLCSGKKYTLRETVQVLEHLKNKMDAEFGFLPDVPEAKQKAMMEIVKQL